MPDTERIPSLDRDKLFIGDGGLETTMIFERGIDLPEFASFLLLETDRGRQALRELLPRLPGDRETSRGRVHARHADMACEPRLGREARLLGG